MDRSVLVVSNAGPKGPRRDLPQLGKILPRSFVAPRDDEVSERVMAVTTAAPEAAGWS